MEGIKLSKKKFLMLNDEDCFMFFENERKDKFSSLPNDQKYDFDYDNLNEELTEQLFKKFDHLLVTPEDKVYGFDGNEYVFLKEAEEVFECSKNLK